MERLSLLMGLDERYATPLRVTIESVLEHLRPGLGIELLLMSTDLGLATRRRLEEAWDERVCLHWVAPDRAKLAAFCDRGFGSPAAANLRLLAGSSLPGTVEKVIYLDADLLVRRDLAEIWSLDLQGKIVLAVQDSHVQRLGPSLPYFNSGVMVIDLASWRATGIEEQCLEAARALPRRRKWLDQHLLNVVLAGRWGALPPVWNKQYALDLLPDWRCSPYREEEFLAARSRPAIIHFCSRTKPWHPFCDHPRDDVLAYHEALRRVTDDVVATKPSLWRRTVEVLAAPHRRLRDRLAAAARARRRAHALQAMLPEMLRLAVLHPWTLVSVPLSVLREQASLRLGAGGPLEPGAW